MTKNYHTPIAAGAAANASTFNSPMEQLDAAISAIGGVYALPGSGAGESVVTVEENSVGVVRQTVITLALTGDDLITLPDGADHGDGALIYTFPAGRILMLGAVIDGVTAIVKADNAGAVVNMAIGTAAASDDDELTSTEANIIASTEVPNGAGAWQAAMAASAQLDGTSSAVALYVNAGVLDKFSSSAVTIELSGTLTVTWINLGTYTP